MTERLTVTAPGRICLFGEHQDFLGLAVIAAAIMVVAVVVCAIAAATSGPTSPTRS